MVIINLSGKRKKKDRFSVRFALVQTGQGNCRTQQRTLLSTYESHRTGCCTGRRDEVVNIGLAVVQILRVMFYDGAIECNHVVVQLQLFSRMGASVLSLGLVLYLPEGE